ncbi:MAG TPA: hypothetical protein VIX35_08870 [Vicinamibacterales bacterium]
MRTLALQVAATAAILTTACAGTTPQRAGPTSTPASADLQPLLARTTLTYTRPRLFDSVNRPGAFTLVRDYRASTDLEELPSVWNDATQTLTTDVSVPIKSENLIFVDDPAIPPGSEMSIRAGRSGLLHEVACPDSVAPEHVCYLLQLLR